MESPLPVAAPPRIVQRQAALAAAFLAVVAGGCGPPRVPPPDLSLDPAALRDQVLAEQRRVRGVQGDARVAVDLDEGSGSLDQFIAAEKPDRLHLEALDFFGNPVAVLVAADGRFALYDSRSKVFYRGEATPENLARLVPLPLPAEDLVAILCGEAPLLDAPATAATPGPGIVRLTLGGGDRVQVLDVGEGGAVERSTLRGASPDYALEFSRFRSRGALRFPAQTKLRASRPKVAIDVEWRRFEVNGRIDPGLFHLEPPRGAKVVDLGPGQEAPPTEPLWQPSPAPASPQGAR